MKGKHLIVSALVSVSILVATLVVSYIVIFDEKPDKEELMKITFIGKSKTSDYWLTVRRGAEEAAKEDAVYMEFTVPDNSQDEIAIINTAVNTRGADALVIASSNINNLREVVEVADSSGVHVIVLDESLDWSSVKGYVTIDNNLAGKLLAEEIVAAQGYNKNIVIVNCEYDSASSIARETALINTLNNFPDIEITAVAHSQATEQSAYEETSDLLRAYDDISAVAALNLISLHGAVRAVFDSEKDIKVFGLNNTNYIIDMMEKDVVQSIVVQSPFNMGYVAVKNAIDLIKGKKINKEEIMDIYIINKQNIYTPENQRLLFPIVK